MTTVERILRWGSGEWSSALLACGHRLRLRRADLKREQLSEGKRVECAECAQAKNERTKT
jgi:hypothetical protein